MINVSLENETDWIVRGTVTSDVSEINLEDDEFRIELKDLLEHYIKRKKSAEMVEAYQKDSTQTLSISNNEVKLVPLKCPVCKGTGLAVTDYPMGRNKTDTSNEHGIFEKKASVFVNPLIQLSDYSNLPDTYFPSDFPWADYGHPEIANDPLLKGILTYTDNFPALSPALYKIEGTNEYYYYENDVVYINEVEYHIKKRKKYNISVYPHENLPDVISDPRGISIYYGKCGEYIWYSKNNPTHYYYYTKEGGTCVRKENCYYCQVDGYSTGNDPNALTVCGEEHKPILTEEFYSNVSTYNNSDMKSLIENGFQFWISEDKKELNFRLTMRGKSSTNPNGYEDKLKTELYKNELYEPTADDIVVDDDEGTKTLYSGRVGFTLAICTISLDATHRICFNITIAPTFKSSDIFRVGIGNAEDNKDNISQIPTKPYKVCPICSGTHYQLNYSAYNGSTISFVQERDCDTCSHSNYDYYMDRYAYPYYNAKKFDDMIFLNNHSATYSSTYDTYWKKNKYVTSSTKDYDATRTNLYAAYTSAIIPNYLVKGSTVDVLSPTQADPHYSTGVRSFEYCYDEGVVSSYLLDSDKSRYCELPWDGNEITLNGFVYVEENGACIYDDLNVNLIRQDIKVGEEGVTIDDMVGKTVFFGTEV